MMILKNCPIFLSGSPPYPPIRPPTPPWRGCGGRGYSLVLLACIHRSGLYRGAQHRERTLTCRSSHFRAPTAERALPRVLATDLTGCPYRKLKTADRDRESADTRSR
jgi:hypothetical protein